MKVFISWSGELSKKIAQAFSEWLPSVIQSVKPYFSPDDIEKGARWFNEISKELNDTDIGIIFVTPDNFESSWLMFEAGALSKKLEKSNLCPILFGIDVTEIKGPLPNFQATKFSKEEIIKLITTINNALEDSGLDQKVLDKVFEKWWPDLDTDNGNS